MIKKIANKRLLTLGIVLFLLSNCQDLYFHKVDSDKQYLVVNGLITTETGPHSVRLSLSTPFGHEAAQKNVSGAQVAIICGNGQEVALAETTPGLYQTPDNFQGQTGSTYVLHIRAPDGNIYESYPQTIMPMVEFGDLFAVITNQSFFFESMISNRLYEDIIQGMQVFFGQSSENNVNPMFRIQSEIYLQYHRIVASPEGVETSYQCWTIKDITKLLQRDVPDYGSGVGYYAHEIGFLPYSQRDISYFFPDHNYLPQRTLITTLYALNDDSFHFHKLKNEQLADEGKFFDPIAANVGGNIYCINDPDRKVFGLFEASSVNRQSFRVTYSTVNEEVTLKPWIDITEIPRHGCLYEEYPNFWIY